MSEHDAHARTATLAKIVGPYFIIGAALLTIRADTLPLLLPALFSDGPLVMISGAFTLILGLTMWALHHYWNSAAAIALSLVALICALEGACLMLAPELMARLSRAFVAGPLIYLLAVISLLLGVWLTLVGWGRETPH